MFCLFAGDTGIFEPPNIFNKYIIERTSEENILKLIRPLFLDSLWEELNKIKKLYGRDRLIKFHNKLAPLKFLDPVCGCGNFLVISYRELRLLELEVLELLLGKKVVAVHDEIEVNVYQFYGVVYTTNAIGPVNYTIQRNLKTRQSFPNDGAATKLVFMILRRISKRWTRLSGIGLKH